MEAAILDYNGHWKYVSVERAEEMVAEGQIERRESWDEDYPDGDLSYERV